LRQWVIASAIALPLAAAFSGQVWLDYAYARVPVSWAAAFAISATDWLLWAALAPLILRLGDRVPLSRRGWLALPLHAAMCLLLVFAKTVAADAWIVPVIAGVERQPASFLKVYVGMATYFAILAAGWAIRASRERRERAVHAARLQSDLTQAELEALKMRLHPHFLFNTLNGIAGLMREDVESADAMLTRLADLLRMSLDTAHLQEVALRDELDFVRTYLDIQRIRFGERLRIDVDVPRDLHLLLVPSLSLQPLVENAIQHGVSRREGPSSLAVRASRAGGALTVSIEDDGPGPPVAVTDGHGLRTTRERLTRLYGPSAALSLRQRDGGGAIAVMVLPARDA
jgi:LytS/YehU family sensor histidine kinase